MRIRKNAKISVLSYFDGSIIPPRARDISSNVETRVCELNRSPWDVISFAPLSCPQEFQFGMNDGNCVRMESVNTVDWLCSVASLKDIMEQEEDDDEEEEDEGRTLSLFINKVDHKAKKEVTKKKNIGLKKQRKGLHESKNYVYCNKTDGKGWRCRREAKQGHSLCEHHLTKLRSYHYNYRTHSTLKPRVQLLKPTLPISTSTTTISTSRRRNRTNSSSSSSSLVDHSSSSDFYYYSGFGPLWGKKRLATESASTSYFRSRVVDDDQKKQLANNDNDDTDDNHCAFGGVVDNDDKEEDDEVDAPKKRFRKPIKARSLKSLL